MKIVVRYAKLDGEDTRETTVNLRTRGRAAFHWYEAVAAAIFHKQDGERIVRISEEEYHG